MERIKQFVKKYYKYVVAGIIVVGLLGLLWSREGYHTRRADNLRETISSIETESHRLEKANRGLEDVIGYLREELAKESNLNRKLEHTITGLSAGRDNIERETDSIIRRVEKIRKLYEETRKKKED